MVGLNGSAYFQKPGLMLTPLCASTSWYLGWGTGDRAPPTSFTTNLIHSPPPPPHLEGLCNLVESLGCGLPRTKQTYNVLLVPPLGFGHVQKRNAMSKPTNCMKHFQSLNSFKIKGSFTTYDIKITLMSNTNHPKTICVDRWYDVAQLLQNTVSYEWNLAITCVCVYDRFHTINHLGIVTNILILCFYYNDFTVILSTVFSSCRIQ